MSLEYKQEQVVTCIGLIYSAAMDCRQWKMVLEELGRCLGGSRVALVDYDFANGDGHIVHACGFDPEYIRSYSDQYAASSPWMQSADWYSQGKVSTGEDFVAEESLVKTEFYSNWLKPQDLFYRLCAVIRCDNTRIFYLEVLRSQSQGRFKDAEKLFFEVIIPHLTQAMSLNRYLWKMVMIEDALRYQPYSILIVDERGEVQFFNKQSDNVLSEENGLYIHDNMLCATKPHINKKLKALIKGASTGSASSDMGESSSGSMALPRGGNQQPISLVVLPMHRKLRRVVGQANHVAIVFVCAPEHAGELPRSVLTTLYGLTHAEERLLQLILDGYRLCDASDELGITQNTARTHMKHIYAKTGAERQVDLVRLFLNWNTLINQPNQPAMIS